MIRYLCRRAVGAALVLVIMSMVLYALIGLMPGDPIDVMVQADPRLTPGGRGPTQGSLRPRSADPRALPELAGGRAHR